MSKRSQVRLEVLLLLAAAQACTRAPGAASGNPEPFTVATVHFEQNASDGDRRSGACPEGIYVFQGTTSSGATFAGGDTLSHQLPTPVTFVRPRSGGEGVALRGLVLSWTSVQEAVAAGTEYVMGVGSVTRQGNVSYVEATFTTAPAP